MDIEIAEERDSDVLSAAADRESRQRERARVRIDHHGPHQQRRTAPDCRFQPCGLHWQFRYAGDPHRYEKA